MYLVRTKEIRPLHMPCPRPIRPSLPFPSLRPSVDNHQGDGNRYNTQFPVLAHDGYQL